MKPVSSKYKQVFERTNGRCHICGKTVHLSKYGKEGRGAWEIDHSVPRSKGGTDRLNNLYPACVSCNRKKQANSTRSARRKNGLSVAPLSKTKELERESNWRWGLGVIFGAVGWGIGGPIGGGIGAFLGSELGKK